MQTRGGLLLKSCYLFLLCRLLVRLSDELENRETKYGRKKIRCKKVLKSSLL